jgi:hypothetical protein
MAVYVPGYGLVLIPPSGGIHPGKPVTPTPPVAGTPAPTPK